MMGKGASWSSDEVKALLSIWREASIQNELDGAVRNKSVFEKIAKRLQDAGFEKDWVQCRAKVKNLKAIYKKVKDNNARSGRARIVCQNFEMLDAILGARPATKSAEVTEAISDDTGNSDAIDTLNDSSQEEGARGSEPEQNESEQGDCAGEQNEGESGKDDEEQSRGDKQPPAKKQKRKGKKTTAEKITE